MSRAQLTSTVEQNTGGAVPPFVAGKNAVINGSMELAQRGTSFTSTTNIYTLDRWQATRYGTAGGTVSQQVATDATYLPQIKYCARIANNSGATSVGTYFVTSLESLESQRFAGQTATFSFYARKGALYSGSNTITANIIGGTGTDQNILSGFTGQATQFTTSPATLSTNWQRFTVTGAVGSSITQLAIVFIAYGSGTAGATDYVEITGVQLELGSVATPFSRAAGTLQGELALCQRYYQRVNNNPSGYGGYGLGSASTTTNVRIDYFFPVQMRTLPSAIDYSTLSSTYAVFDGQNLLIPTAITYNSNESYVNQIHLDLTVSGAVQFRPYKGIFQGSSSGYLGFSAEL